MNIGKLAERKFSIPGSTALLALANDFGKLGIEFKVMVLLVAASLVWAAIEAASDIARLKYGAGKEA